MAEERWLPVAGFEGYYEVSDRGRVRGVARVISCEKVGVRRLPSRIRPTQKRPNGYVFVALCKEGKKYQKSVHRMVAEAFIPNQGNLPAVNHKDENKSNNLASNLEWCTHQYNRRYGTGIARSAHAEGQRVEAINKDGFVVASFRSAAEAQRMTGINRCVISACVHGRVKSAGGYSWRLAS